MTDQADLNVLTELYARIALTGAGADNQRLAHVAAGPVSVDEIVVAHGRNADAPPLAAVCLRFPHSLVPSPAPGSIDFGNHTADLALVCHPGLPHQHDSPVSDGADTLLDASVVHTSQPHPPPLKGPLHAEHQPVDPEAAEQLRATVACLNHVVDIAPAAGPTTLLYDSCARVLSTSLLACMPRTAGAPAAGDGNRHSSTLQLAMEFINRHADQSLTLADIAAAAHVTSRAVQYSFAQLRTTPMTYLRQVRLVGAHAELQAADPDTSTVADVAVRWGFNHPGHFAAHYRDAYGTTPSATLNEPPPLRMG